MNRDTLAALFLDYINNYLTVDVFAEHHGLYPDEAAALLEVARQCHQVPHPDA